MKIHTKHETSTAHVYKTLRMWKRLEQGVLCMRLENLDFSFLRLSQILDNHPKFHQLHKVLALVFTIGVIAYRINLFITRPNCNLYMTKASCSCQRTQVWAMQWDIICCWWHEIVEIRSQERAMLTRRKKEKILPSSYRSIFVFLVRIHTLHFCSVAKTVCSLLVTLLKVFSVFVSENTVELELEVFFI